jgi:hypothetical protein
MRLEDPVDGVEVELRRHVHDGEQLGNQMGGEWSSLRDTNPR